MPPELFAPLSLCRRATERCCRTFAMFLLYLPVRTALLWPTCAARCARRGSGSAGGRGGQEGERERASVRGGREGKGREGKGGEARRWRGVRACGWDGGEAGVHDGQLCASEQVRKNALQPTHCCGGLQAAEIGPPRKRDVVVRLRFPCSGGSHIAAGVAAVRSDTTPYGIPRRV